MNTDSIRREMIELSRDIRSTGQHIMLFCTLAHHYASRINIRPVEVAFNFKDAATQDKTLQLLAPLLRKDGASLEGSNAPGSCKIVFADNGFKCEIKQYTWYKHLMTSKLRVTDRIHDWMHEHVNETWNHAYDKIIEYATLKGRMLNYQGQDSSIAWHMACVARVGHVFCQNAFAEKSTETIRPFLSKYLKGLL